MLQIHPKQMNSYTYHCKNSINKKIALSSIILLKIGVALAADFVLEFIALTAEMCWTDPVGPMSGASHGPIAASDRVSKSSPSPLLMS